MITLDKSLRRDEARPEVSDRLFGVIVGILLAAIAAGPLVFGRPLKGTLLGVALGLLATGLLCPVLLKWPKRVWFFITHKISLVVNFVLLSIIFFGVVTPVALFFRLVGRDPLRRRIDPDAPTYWVPREETAGAGTMRNQF